jgi:putative transposase
MPRPARIVVPDVPHHITQRGNRQLQIFFSDADRQRYVDMLAEACTAHAVKCLAWCLMDNHVHLILVPPSANSLRAVLASTHTRYAQRVNYHNGLTGHLFQGRYASYAMDDAHLMFAVRYVENNPVKAGLVKDAGDWRWSSARAHLFGVDDRLTDITATGRHVPNWRAYLIDGVEAAERDDAVEAAMRSGRPLGRSEWVAQHAAPVRPRGRRWPEKNILLGTVPITINKDCP